MSVAKLHLNCEKGLPATRNNRINTKQYEFMMDRTFSTLVVGVLKTHVEPTSRHEN